MDGFSELRVPMHGVLPRSSGDLGRSCFLPHLGSVEHVCLVMIVHGRCVLVLRGVSCLCFECLGVIGTAVFELGASVSVAAPVIGEEQSLISIMR